MNYDEARQIAPTPDSLGGWHWTTMNDGRIRTAAPCRLYTGPVRSVADMMRAPVRGSDFTTCAPHETREEAERHFYDYSREEAMAHEVDISWSNCRYPECKNPANHALGVGRLDLFGSLTPLCDDHRNANGWEAANPFYTPMFLMHS